MYFLKKIADYRKIKINKTNLNQIFSNYNLAIKIIKKLIEYEKEKLGAEYNHAYYFKSNRLKENYLKCEEEIIKEFYEEKDDTTNANSKTN